MGKGRGKFPSATFILLLTGKSSIRELSSINMQDNRDIEIKHEILYIIIQDSKNHSQLQRITYNRMRNEFEAHIKMIGWSES